MDVTVSMKCEHEELKTKTIFDAAFKNITSATLAEGILYTKIAPAIVGMMGRYSDITNNYQVTHCNTFDSENIYGDTWDKIPYCDVIISVKRVGIESNLTPYYVIISADNCNWYNTNADNYLIKILDAKLKDAFLGIPSPTDYMEVNSVTLIVKGDLK